MGVIASQITSLTIVYSTIYSSTDRSKHQSSTSLAFVLGIHRSPVNSPPKVPVARKIVPFDDVIMSLTMVLQTVVKFIQGPLIYFFLNLNKDMFVVVYNMLHYCPALLGPREKLAFFWFDKPSTLFTWWPAGINLPIHMAECGHGFFAVLGTRWAIGGRWLDSGVTRLPRWRRRKTRLRGRPLLTML